MSLSDAGVRATIAVSDIERAAEFYEGKLGLTPLPEGSTGAALRIYPCGSGSRLQVYVTEHAGSGGATVASWSVPDFDELTAELRANGVEFERNEGMEADEHGVHAFGTHKMVWFADPDGNIIGLDNGPG